MGAVASYFASLSLPGLFARIPAGVAQGLVWGLMALGVYITFRLLDIADLSVDGTFSTGSAVVVIVAGTVTGLLHTKLGIPAILSGILTQYALYSINLAIMGFKANQAVSVDKYALIISSRTIPKAILTGVLFSAAIIALLYWFFGTELGSSIRATGCNQQMAKAQGININSMKVLGLAISNGLVAMAGALSAQYSGFADVNSGRGAIVIGLAAVIIGEVIGEALLGKHLNFAGRLAFVVIGGILYYIVYTVVLWLKLDSNLMKLFTAVIVAIFLAVPYLRGQSKSSFRRAGKDAAASAVEAYDRDPYAWDKPDNANSAKSADTADAAQAGSADKGVK